jgi:hypothetical protein
MSSRLLRPPLVAAGAVLVALAGAAAADAAKAPVPGLPAAAPAAGKPAPPLPALAQRFPVRGWVVLSSGTLTAPNGRQTRGVANCPIGKVPIGGGVFVQSGSTLANVNSSFPTAAGWDADVNNASGFDTTFDVRVVCARRPVNYTLVANGPADLPAGTQRTINVTCPADAHPLGGGALSFSGDLFVNVNSTFPSNGGWRVDENNNSGADSTFTGFVICGRLPNWQIVSNGPFTVPTDEQFGLSALCPDGLLETGGGILSSSTSVDVNVNTSAPVSTEWDSFQNNASPFDDLATAFAVCAGKLL